MGSRRNVATGLAMRGIVAALVFATGLPGAPSQGRPDRTPDAQVVASPAVYARLIAAHLPGQARVQPEPCFTRHQVAVENATNEPWEARELVIHEFATNPARATPPLVVTLVPQRVEPATNIELPVLVTRHWQSEGRIDVRLYDQRGKRLEVEARDSLSQEGRRTLAARQCLDEVERGTSSHELRQQVRASQDACRCETGDVGRPCDGKATCEGVCILARFENRAVGVEGCQGGKTKGPRDTCAPIRPLWHGIGRCSAVRTPLGCTEVVPAGAADDASPRPLRQRTCVKGLRATISDQPADGS